MFIAHQTNCISTFALGLAKNIFDIFPWSNIYHSHTIRIPGKIIVCGNGKDQRFIVNMMGQKYPGKSDSKEQKLIWFRQCLNEISLFTRTFKNVSIAFPYKIGCGMAGGQWSDYLSILELFANTHPNICVVIYNESVK